MNIFGKFFVCLFGFVVEFNWLLDSFDSRSWKYLLLVWMGWNLGWVSCCRLVSTDLLFAAEKKKKNYLVHLDLMKSVCIVVGACSLVYYRPAAALEYYRLLSFWIWCSSAASLGNPRPWIMFSWLLLPCLWTLLQQRLGPWATLQ